MTIKPPIDLQRPAEQARPLRAALDISDRLERADQDRRGMSLGLGDHVHAMMDAIDQVDVGEAGRTEHDLGARGPAAREWAARSCGPR